MTPAIRLVVLLFIACQCTLLQAQDGQPLEKFKLELKKEMFINRDSLSSLGNAAITNTALRGDTSTLVQIYLDLSSAFLKKDQIDSSKIYARLALSISNERLDTNAMIESHLIYSNALAYDEPNYDASFENLSMAIWLAKANRNEKLLAKSLTKQVKRYYLVNNFIKAYASCKELSKLTIINQDTSKLINTYNLLCYIYGELRMKNMQMEMVYRSLALSTSIKDTTSMYLINDTGIKAYLQNGIPDSALYYAKLNIPLAKGAKRDYVCYSNLAKAYFEAHQVDSAKYYFEKLLTLQIENHTYIDIEEYYYLGKIEFTLGNYTQARKYFSIAESNIKKPTIVIQKEIYKALSDYYLVMDDPDKAIKYLNKSYQLLDSIIEVNSQISFMEVESEKLWNQNQLLIKERELTDVRISNKARLDKIAFASISLAVLLTCWGFIRYKKIKNQKARQDLINERLRISRELHDEVGGTLSGIAMYSHVLKDQIKDKNMVTAHQSIDYMNKAAGEMVTKLGDIIWLLNPDHDLLSTMIVKLEDYAKKMAKIKGMKVNMTVDPSIAHIHLPVEAHKNIYLICKETIHNAIKYSNAIDLRIEVLNHQSTLEFIIQDNGLGFDLHGVQRGNGLINMEKRANAIGAALKINTQISKGTKMELQYNLLQ